ncbi:MAG: NeuD/PglB/VioB family sugar acetyltransferase [Flavobacteriaceae bacterium]
MSDKKVAIIGYSGHGYVISDIAISVGLNLKFYTEKHELNKNPYGLDYLGFELDKSFFNNIENIEFILGLGNNEIRRKVYNLLISKRVNVLNVVDSSSLISKNSFIGKGNFISRGVIINALAKVGNACILNTGCIIEHECVLGDAVHIAPGAVLAGNVNVEDGAFIGANTIIKEGVNIGKNVIIGAGSVVVKDVPDDVIGYGNPYRIKNKSK